MGFIKGHKLMAVSIDPRSGRTVFSFDLGATLEVRRMKAADRECLWELREPTGYVLSIRGDGTYDNGPASGTDRRPGVRGHVIDVTHVQ